MGFEVVINPTFIRALYRKLVFAGYTPKQAGNVIAKLMGLVASEKGWTVKQLVDLWFLQYLDRKKSK